MPRKLTIHDLFEARREGRQLTQVYTDDPLEAAAAQAAGVHLITCRKDCVPAIRAAAPDVFIVTALGIYDPQVVGEDQAIAGGFQCLRNGADAIYTGLSCERIRAMAREKIPTIGHVGYVPYHNSWIGGARAIGKKAEEALLVYRKALEYQEAGAIGIEMEIVPHRIATEICKRLDILVISMGSGTGGAIQYLFATDVLGTNQGHVPRHAKIYADLHKELERIQQMRVEAFQALKHDIDSGGYPEPAHLVEVEDEEYEKFLAEIDRIG